MQLTAPSNCISRKMAVRRLSVIDDESHGLAPSLLDEGAGGTREDAVGVIMGADVVMLLVKHFPSIVSTRIVETCHTQPCCHSLPPSWPLSLHDFGSVSVCMVYVPACLCLSASVSLQADTDGQIDRQRDRETRTAAERQRRDGAGRCRAGQDGARWEGMGLDGPHRMGGMERAGWAVGRTDGRADALADG